MSTSAEAGGSAREFEFTWTRSECLGHVKAWNPRGSLPWKILAVALLVLAALVGSTGGVVLALVFLAYLVGWELSLPRRMWRQQNPSLSGTHRYTWTDDAITAEVGAAVLTMGAGELTEALDRNGFVVVRLRALRGLAIPVRAFAGYEQRRDFLAVARSIARSDPSVTAAAADRRATRRQQIICVAVVVAAAVVGAVSRVG